MDPATLGIMLSIELGMAIIGGAIGAKSYGDEYNQWLEDVAAEEAEKLREKNAKETELTTRFEVDKAEAEHNADLQRLEADRSDYFSTQNEVSASDEFNDSFDLLNLQFAGQNEDYLNQASAIGRNTGDSLSAAAASGTRTSSMMDAIDMEAATNAKQLELADQTQKANQRYQLNNLLRNLSNNVNGIQKQRWQANDLRNQADYLEAQYKEGGGQYSIYQLNLQQNQDNYDAYMKESERLKKRAEDNYTKGALNAMFGGAYAGFKFGKDVYNFGSDIFSVE